LVCAPVISKLSHLLRSDRISGGKACSSIQFNLSLRMRDKFVDDVIEIIIDALCKLEEGESAIKIFRPDGYSLFTRTGKTAS
jgi:hypothetical protein